VEFLKISLTLPDALYRELLEVCQQRGCSPPKLAAEVLEVFLAERRYQRLPDNPATTATDLEAIR
jgi:hypothetical protein